MSAFAESKLDNDLVAKAVNALLKYELKKAGEGSKGKALLVSNYAKPVLVQVQLFKDVVRPVTKPTRVKIPHSLFNAEDEDNTICLFCRSDDKESITQFLEKNPIQGLTKVLSINDAKKHYNQFKDKKALLNEHTHFICDSRVAGQLYNILGSTFSARSDYPVQINFTNPAQLPGLVKKVVDSTYFHLAGRNLSIRLGHTAMNPGEVVANLLEGIPFAVEKLQNGWKDVHSIHLKTSDSAALPVYTRGSSEMMQYVVAQAAAIPAPATAASSSSSAVATPGKGKKAAVAVEKPATPAPASAKKSAAVKEAASGKKRKAEVAPEEVVPAAASAPASTKKTAVTPAAAPAPKSAKKAKVAAQQQEVEEEETPVAPTTPAAAAPKSAMKAGKNAKSAAPAVVPEVEVEAPKSTVKAAAASTASAVSSRKTPAKTAAAAKEKEAAVAMEVEPTPRKSARRGAAKEEVEGEKEVVVAAVTPSARAAPKRATSARK